MGFSRALEDFSIRKPLINGGYRQTQKNVARKHSVSAILSIEQANNLFDFYHAFRSKPFPITALHNMPISQKEAQEYSGFCYMIDAPEMISVDGQGTYQNVTFNISEVI